MIKNILLVVLYICCISVFIVFQSCSEKAPTKVFDELIDSTDVGEVKFLTIPKPEFESTGAVLVNTGSSPYLYLGQADGKRASIAIRFFGIEDSIAFTEARIVFKSSGFLGEPGSMVTATVHEITTIWNQNELKYDDTVSDFFDPTPLGNLTFSASDSDTVSISFDTALVNRWAALPDSQRFGVLIRSESAFAWQRFNSLNSASEQPKLQLFHNDTTRANPIELIASTDVFVFEILSQPVEGPLYVGNGFEHKTILRYDLSGIPKEATINRAKLILKIDSTNSFLNHTDGFALGAENLLEEVTDPAVSADSLVLMNKIFPLSTTLGVIDTSKTLTINMNNQLQAWTAERQENFGIIFITRIPGRDLYRVALFSSKTDSSNAPKLEIQYTLPPITKRKIDE